MKVRYRSNAIRAWLCTPVFALNMLAACSQETQPIQDTHTMNSIPSGSRPPAPQVPPIEHNGIRYEQDAHDERQGDQAGGYLVAIDASTDKRLWRLKVYEVPDQGASGVQLSIYFRAMHLAGGGDVLEIEDETGRVFHVKLATRGVTQTAGPAATAPKQAAKPKPAPE